MPRHLASRHAVVVTGKMPRDGDEPMAARRRPKKSAKVIDSEALAATRAALAQRAAVYLATGVDPEIGVRSGNRLPATGSCHECGRAVSGERRYCGRCAANR